MIRICLVSSGKAYWADKWLPFFHAGSSQEQTSKEPRIHKMVRRRVSKFLSSNFLSKNFQINSLQVLATPIITTLLERGWQVQ